MVGDRVGAIIRDMGDGDPCRGRGGDIELIVPDCRATDHLNARALSEDTTRVRFIPGADTIGSRARCAEVLGAPAWPGCEGREIPPPAAASISHTVPGLVATICQGACRPIPTIPILPRLPYVIRLLCTQRCGRYCTAARAPRRAIVGAKVGHTYTAPDPLPDNVRR